MAKPPKNKPEATGPGPDTLHRLIISRQLLTSAGGPLSRQADAVAVARAILAAHDAAELVLATIGSELNANTSDKTYLLQYPDALEKAKPRPRFPGRPFLRRLNRVRNSFKHAGLLPHVA